VGKHDLDHGLAAPWPAQEMPTRLRDCAGMLLMHGLLTSCEWLKVRKRMERKKCQIKRIKPRT
jgi:hypothetical protein